MLSSTFDRSTNTDGRLSNIHIQQFAGTDCAGGDQSEPLASLRFAATFLAMQFPLQYDFITRYSLLSYKVTVVWFDMDGSIDYFPLCVPTLSKRIAINRETF